jgi:Flp pilus assembly protein TadG
MPSRSIHHRHAGRGQHGQILVLTALAMVAMISGVSLVVEAGNAYAHQRVVQNASDSVANAGATVIAERLGGAGKFDSDVKAAMDAMAAANGLDTYRAYYTNVFGQPLNTTGVVVGSVGGAEQVGAADGSTVIPPNTQGVRMAGDQVFGTTFARVLGIDQFTASAGATAVAGALSGGRFFPVVFPVSMAGCAGTGEQVEVDAPWRLSDPGTPHPNGQEWMIPLCKSGDGSFMILDLDPDKTCYEEVINPSSIQFNDFPVNVHVEVGNDCAKKIEQATVDAKLQGTVIFIPICDNACTTQSGTGGYYHIIRIAAFWLDYISYSNNPSNPACAATVSPTYGTNIINIVGGNGSASCMAGWFVRYVTSGPVGSGAIFDGEALGVQLIR